MLKPKPIESSNQTKTGLDNENEVCSLVEKSQKVRDRSLSPKKHVTFGENSVVEIKSKPSKKIVKNSKIKDESVSKKPNSVLESTGVNEPIKDPKSKQVIDFYIIDENINIYFVHEML